MAQGKIDSQGIDLISNKTSGRKGYEKNKEIPPQNKIHRPKVDRRAHGTNTWDLLIGKHERILT